VGIAGKKESGLAEVVLMDSVSRNPTYSESERNI
jgi:hypothetical protein